MKNLKLSLEVGERSVDLSFRGLDPRRERDMLQKVLEGFLADLDEDLQALSEAEEETVAEPVVESEPEQIEEIQEVAEALGYKEEDFAAALEAYDQIEPEKKERERGSIHFLSDYQLNGSAKKSRDGQTMLYQTYYKCTRCRNKGKHFLTPGTRFCNCHECGEQLTMRRAVDGPFPHIDEWGNVFIAGDFQRAEEREYTYS